MTATGPIPAHVRANFQTMLKAAKDGRLALVSCSDHATGAPRYVVVAISDTEKPGVIDLVPFGHLCIGNPYEEYVPPSVESA